MNAERRFSFGPYRLDLDQRMLFRGTEPVSLTPRLFDLLVLLVSHAGRVVSKDEILEQVWGKTVVEDGTITWHLHALRQALANGDEAAKYIDTVPKRGYRFVAELRPAEDRRRAPESSPAPAALASVARPKFRTWWAAAAVLVILAGGFFFLNRNTEPALPYAQRDWLLVSSFENQTGEARFDGALLTALMVSLEQSTFVNVYPRSRVTTSLERMRKPAESVLDDALAREICLREGLRALISPSITRTGKEYAVAARLTDPKSGNTVRAYLIHADDESRILGAIQELATRVRGDLGESIGQIAASNRPLEQVTTPVLAALQYYSQGTEAVSLARMGDAIQNFEAAISADPDFAMAHAALGRINYGTTRNRPDLGNEYFQRALALSSRTTARERQIIAADFATSRGHVSEAETLYAAYTTSYPDDLSMHVRIGDMLLTAGQFERSAAAFRKVLAIDPNATRANFSLGAALANLGEYVEARKYIERAIAIEPTLPSRGVFGYTYGFVMFGAGDRAAATKFFEGQLASAPERYRAERSLGLIDLHDGKYASAARRFQAAVDGTNGNSDENLSRARNLGYLATALAGRGDRAGALRALDLGVASLDAHGPSPVEFRSRLAVAYARLGNLDAARREFALVAERADPLRSRDRATLAYTQGEIELASGHAEKAVELMRPNANIGIEASMLLEARARAIEATGDRKAAIAAWQELTQLRGSWLGWEAQQGWLLSHLRLAKLLHAQSEDAAAVVALQPLLSRWTDADTDLPAAIEARKLHAELIAPRALAHSRSPGG